MEGNMLKKVTMHLTAQNGGQSTIVGSGADINAAKDAAIQQAVKIPFKSWPADSEVWYAIEALEDAGYTWRWEAVKCHQ